MRQATKLWIIIGVLFILNGFLLYTNYKKSRNIQRLRNQHSSVVNTEKKLPFTPPTSIDTSLIKDDLPIQLIVIFPKKNCSVCLEIELPNLKHFSKKYSKEIELIDIGMKYNLKSMLGKEVSILHMESERKYLPWLKNSVNVPILFVVDSFGKVQLFYVNNYTNPDDTKKFYTKINSLFESVYS